MAAHIPSEDLAATSTSPPSKPGPASIQPLTNVHTRSPPTAATKDSMLKQPTSPSYSYRSSYIENFRNHPSSPRTHRQPSLSQQALQELLNNPPVGKMEVDPTLAGRDWRKIHVGEIIDENQVRFVEMTTSVEEATNVLIASGSPNVVLLRDSPNSRTAIGTFDYSDLNAYLLLVVGLAQPDERHSLGFKELASKGREGKPIPLKDVKELGRKEPLITLPHTADLTKAVEIFGSGIHRIIVVKEHSADVIGILTQLRLVQFFWENGRNFTVIEQLYSSPLKDLDIGSRSVLAINGDKPLTDALELMHNEGITSLPVLDNQLNVVGNISQVDVRLLTKSTSLPLLRSSCIHFISVILSERGVDDGKDSFPVFHVNPFSTLAHTIAKLVATRSHRMWITESPSPASSGPPTPSLTPSVLVPPPLAYHSHSLPHPANHPGPPYTSTTPSSPPQTSISASAIPGASISGRLSGVVSLTDILNLFARASGLSPHDPDETRRSRRRSSSASLSALSATGSATGVIGPGLIAGGTPRRSIDSGRSESDMSRSGSISGRR